MWLPSTTPKTLDMLRSSSNSFVTLLMLLVNFYITKGFQCFLIQKSLTMINAMLSTTSYTSPHICKVLPLLKWNRVMVICVSNGMQGFIRRIGLPNDRATILHK